MTEIKIVSAEMVEKISKAKQKPYFCLELTFANGYSKDVLLSYYDLYKINEK